MKLVTWKRTPRDLDDIHVKPRYKTKRTLRADLDEAHAAREAAIEERKDVQRLLTQETQIAQDAIRQRDEARSELGQAWGHAEEWEDAYNDVAQKLFEVGKARDEALAFAGEYAKVLHDIYGYTPPLHADWTDQPTDEQPEQVEEFPSLFMQVAQEHKAEHPEVEGHTMTWPRLTPEQEAELQAALPPVEAWGVFEATIPTVDKPKRKRVPAARKAGDGS